jgi:wyosine [tRNA(Phe)-imidazoG37] synthetase (radical SAM superfamily)
LEKQTCLGNNWVSPGLGAGAATERSTIDVTRRYNLRVFAHHPREWQRNRYVYPVISRRSRGLSVGVNLNPDAVCNFDCVYCQVDRSQPPKVRRVDTAVLAEELDQMLGWAADRSIFEHPQFERVPDELKRVNDIAFSGDGEPTTCPVFPESVAIAADLKKKWSLGDTKLVLITHAGSLTRPKVAAALDVMMANNGEIWAKLDAGTEEYFQAIARTKFTLRQIVDSITATARTYPVVIQSLWMRLHDEPPAAGEIDAFVDRLAEVLDGGGRISLVQVYTVARKPTESYVTPLTSDELESIAAAVRDRTGLATATY